VLFFNTALVAYCVEILSFENYYGPGGLIFGESMMFVCNSILPPLAWYWDPWSTEKDVVRQRHRQLGEKSFLTQKEANE
jgi:hypothetical protein